MIRDRTSVHQIILERIEIKCLKWFGLMRMDPYGYGGEASS